MKARDMLYIKAMIVRLIKQYGIEAIEQNVKEVKEEWNRESPTRF